MTETVDWILRNAHIADGAPVVDIALVNGRIQAIGAQLPLTGAQEWDLAGRVVLPGLVDAHVHLDKTLFPLPNHSGTLLEAIEIWRASRHALTKASFVERATQALKMAVQMGTTAIRTHIDTVEASDLLAMEAIVAVREQWRAYIDIQIVALGHPGESAANDAVMREALRLGADFVGGVPALMADPKAAVCGAFALAEQTGKPIDLHVDETEDPQANSLECLAEQTIAHGLQGQVTAGHCCSLAFMDAPVVERVLDKVAQAQLNIITLPSCNLVLMGRSHKPCPRGITPVKEMLVRGINVCAASDNVSDPFNPFGAYDLLQMANLAAHVAHLSGDAEILSSLQMITRHPAQALGLKNYGVQVGVQADLVVVDASTLQTALTTIAPRLATFKHGRLVVRTEISRQWAVGQRLSRDKFIERVNCHATSADLQLPK
ncbi:MAG: amidohydrolase family protein [Caldilineaceae bacterium]